MLLKISCIRLDLIKPYYSYDDFCIHTMMMMTITVAERDTNSHYKEIYLLPKEWRLQI